jgi:hypothetical protein
MIISMRVKPLDDIPSPGHRSSIIGFVPFPNCPLAGMDGGSAGQNAIYVPAVLFPFEKERESSSPSLI